MSVTLCELAAPNPNIGPETQPETVQELIEWTKAHPLRWFMPGLILEQGIHVLHGLDAATDGEGHEALVGGAFDHLHHRAASVRGGGDVEEHHLVRALLVVAQGEFHGVANVAQTALFGDAELDAASDVAVMDIQARDDTFCNHGSILPFPARN